MSIIIRTTEQPAPTQPIIIRTTEQGMAHQGDTDMGQFLIVAAGPVGAGRHPPIALSRIGAIFATSAAELEATANGQYAGAIEQHRRIEARLGQLHAEAAASGYIEAVAAASE